MSFKQVNLVVPAAGRGSRFEVDGWRNPKPLIDVDDDPMINKVVDNVRPALSSVTVIARSEHQSIFENALVSDGLIDNLVLTSQVTEGTACTVLLARKLIDNESPLLIANSDQLVDFNVDDFVEDCLERGLDGSILVFRDESRDPKWSFAKTDETGLVSQVAEKVAISDLATVGIYFFAKGSEFVSSAIDMIVNNRRVNGEFYTCPIYNEMIADRKHIGVYEVAPSSMSGLGTPDDLREYLTRRGLPPSKDDPEASR